MEEVLKHEPISSAPKVNRSLSRCVLLLLVSTPFLDVDSGAGRLGIFWLKESEEGGVVSEATTAFTLLSRIPILGWGVGLRFRFRFKLDLGFIGGCLQYIS